MKNRHCLALDLKDDPALIAQYRHRHQRIWPEVAEHLRACGVLDLQIWQLGNRLFMVMEVAATFSFQAMEHAVSLNPRLQEWEEQMWRYQAPTPWTPPGHKWMAMERIFDLAEQP